MIGQKNNLKTIEQWRKNKAIPRFILIFGEYGSGRLTLAKVIVKCLKATGIIVGSGIEDVRTTIENAYTLTSPTFYIFRNADDMSTPAKNSLLKVVEEPPNNAYFIVTVQNIDNMLGTIKSRGTVIKMEPYSQEELKSACDNDMLLHYASNIGQLHVDLKQLEQTEKCVDEIRQAWQEKSGTKLSKQLKGLKAKQTETDKIDCMLFMRVFMRSLKDFDSLTPNILTHINQCNKQLQSKTLNKKSAIECMFIQILEELKNAEISSTLG